MIIPIIVTFVWAVVSPIPWFRLLNILSASWMLAEIAQKEILWKYGGVYIDADFECFRPCGHFFETDHVDEKTKLWFEDDSIRVAEYWVREEVDGCKQYYTLKERCIYCDIIYQELDSKSAARGAHGLANANFASSAKRLSSCQVNEIDTRDAEYYKPEKPHDQNSRNADRVPNAKIEVRQRSKTDPRYDFAGGLWAELVDDGIEPGLQAIGINAFGE